MRKVEGIKQQQVSVSEDRRQEARAGNVSSEMTQVENVLLVTLMNY